MTEPSGVPPAPPTDPYDAEIDVRGWGRTLWRYRLLVGAAACTGAVVAAAIGIMTPHLPTATARLEIDPGAGPGVPYSLVVQDPSVSQQVVAELGLEGPPYSLSAAQFQSAALASTTIPSSGIAISVRMNDAVMAIRAANVAALRTVELAQRLEVRARIRDAVAQIISETTQGANMLLDIQLEEFGLRTLQRIMLDGNLRNPTLQAEAVLMQVRIAQGHARHDRIAQRNKIASEIAQIISRLSPTDGVPQEVATKLATLGLSFPIAPGVAPPPIRVVEQATLSSPAPWRAVARSVVLGTTLGLVLSIVGSFVVFILTENRKPTIA